MDPYREPTMLFLGTPIWITQDVHLRWSVEIEWYGRRQQIPLRSGCQPEECLEAARGVIDLLATFEMHGLLGSDGLLRQELAG